MAREKISLVYAHGYVERLRDNATREEWILKEALANNSKTWSFKFQIPLIIISRAGQNLLILDFFSLMFGIGIEVDGGHHYRLVNKKLNQSSTKKSDVFKGEGIEILRFTNERVNSDLSGVMEDILKAIKNCKPDTSSLFESGGVYYINKTYSQ